MATVPLIIASKHVPNAGLWTLSQAYVVPGNNGIVDTFPTDSYSAVSYFFRVKGRTNAKTKAFAAHLVKREAGPSGAVHGIIGDAIKAPIAFEVTGSNTVVRMRNDEAYELDVSVAKMVIT